MLIKNPRVLIIDDNEDVLVAAKLLLKQQVGFIQTEKDPEIIPMLLKETSFDVIFLDMNFTHDMTSGEEGFYWLSEIMKIDSTAVVILITAFGDVETAVKAVKDGATDFVLKPWQNEKFLATFASALKLRESRLELENLRSKQKQLSHDLDHKYHEIVGTSEQMQELYKTIDKVAGTDANVLILGDNGTGKESVARALHRKSSRADEVFISVDMGAISQTLFESELFGHVKGAFTDAKEDRAGRFEIASGGTLFLDEIGNLPIELQAKLLTVIQNQEVVRVGSNKIISTNVRLICATNMPIYELVKENKFRQDLLYRINTVEINIPSLYERKEDIKLLAEHFLSIFKNKYLKHDLAINPMTLRKLESYHWPGNVRELEHAIERGVILCEDRELHPDDFFLKDVESNEDENFEINSFKLDDIEKSVIQKTLRKYDGNISKAAKELGLTRTSLYRRLEKFNL